MDISKDQIIMHIRMIS